MVSLLQQSLPARTLGRYLQIQGARRGAAVAFYAAFSFAPISVLLLAVLNFWLGPEHASAVFFEHLGSLVGEREAQTLAELMRARGSDPKAPIAFLLELPLQASTAAALTFIGATGAVVELRNAVKAIFGEPEPAFFSWQFVRGRLVAVALVLATGTLICVAIALQALAILAMAYLSKLWPAAAIVVGLTEAITSWGFMAVLFAMLIRFLPDRRPTWRMSLSGGAVAALAFIVGRIVLSAYLAVIVSTRQFGIFGSFVALLIWVYWSAQIFLYGAAWTALRSESRAAP